MLLLFLFKKSGYKLFEVFFQSAEITAAIHATLHAVVKGHRDVHHRADSEDIIFKRDSSS